MSKLTRHRMGIGWASAPRALIVQTPAQQPANLGWSGEPLLSFRYPHHPEDS